MDGSAPQSGRTTAPSDAADLLVAPAAILEGLPDAVVAMDRDGRIVFANALAEELFGYSRAEIVGQPVTMLWAVRVRKRYQRNLELYFATQHPLRFTAEAWGLRRDGTEFIGEMSWGIVETERGPLLLAIGRDVSERHARDERVHALAAMGDRALAGAEPAELAREAVELLRSRLPVRGAGVRLGDGRTLAEAGRLRRSPMRLPIGTGDELLVTPSRDLTDEEMGIVRAVANTLTVALARLRDEAQMRHDAVHDPLTHLANRILLRDRLEQARARAAREGGETGVLYVDLDGFKAINDTHGHGAGDAVLVEFGARLTSAVRARGHGRARGRRRVRRRLRPDRRRRRPVARHPAPGRDPPAGRRRGPRASRSRRASASPSGATRSRCSRTPTRRGTARRARAAAGWRWSAATEHGGVSRRGGPRPRARRRSPPRRRRARPAGTGRSERASGS